MKIIVVGGGISGLYIANKLSKNNDVTIFESNSWGGDIKTEYINGECYPVSTILQIRRHPELNYLIDKLDIKTKYISSFRLIRFINMKYYIFIMIILIILNKFNIIKNIYILLLLLFILVLINLSCITIKSWGNSKKCSLKNTLLFLFPVLYPKKLLYDCGYQDIVNYYISNENINYINNGVINIDRKNKITIDSKNNIYNYDKIIISCPYKYYKNIINLYEYENNILKQTKYFDFYSTLVKFSDNNKQLYNSNVISRVKIKDAYLFASYKPIKFENVDFIKTYKWEMPDSDINTRNTRNKKKNINKKNNDVFYIGKEINGNGVELCLNYCDKIIKFLDSLDMFF